ncbi:MAG: arylesterase [Proteobacteria bacterium]|jgi:acyl-CoA thioesterase I|nr:arylesterase [Pseudomonadota bacterium]MBT5226193.1 arylesterase [Pseudomonadota bacterium]MBT6348771.1 arylesterase [Pseudomonadota bacterium]
MASKTSSFTALLLLFLLLVGASARASLPTVLVIGDSITSGYGIPFEKNWVSLAQNRMRSKVRFINAAISGETTAGASRNLPGLLDEHRPRVVILEIGGNDGLRGHPPAVIYENLAGMIERSLQAGADVLLTGIDIPSNYGPAYRDAFRSVYTKLAADYAIAFVPSIITDIFSHPEMFQEDGVHLNEAAQQLIADRICPVIDTLID